MDVVRDKARNFIINTVISHSDYSEYTRDQIFVGDNELIFDVFFREKDHKTLFIHKTNDRALVLTISFPNAYKHGVHCFVKTSPFREDMTFGFENIVYFMIYDNFVNEMAHVFNDVLLPDLISADTLTTKMGLAIANAFTTFAGSLTILSNSLPKTHYFSIKQLAHQQKKIKLIIPKLISDINAVGYNEYRDTFSRHLVNKKVVQIWENNLYSYAENILRIWYTQVLAFVKHGFLYKTDSQELNQVQNGTGANQSSITDLPSTQETQRAASASAGKTRKNDTQLGQVQKIVYNDAEYNYWNVLFQKNKGPMTFELPSVFSDSASKLKRSKIDALYERLLTNTEEKKTVIQNSSNIITIFGEEVYDAGIFPSFDSPFAKVAPLVPTSYKNLFNMDEFNRVLNVQEVEDCLNNTMSQIKGKYASFTPNIPKDYLTDLLNLKEGSFLMLYYSWVKRNEILFDLNEQMSTPQAQTLVKMLEFKKSNLLIHYGKLLRLFNDVLLEAREMNCVMGSILPCMLKMHTLVCMDQSKQAYGSLKTARQGAEVLSNFTKSISNSTYFTIFNVLGMALSHTKKFGALRFGDVNKAIFRDIIFACQRFIGPDNMFFSNPEKYLDNVTAVIERLDNIRKCFLQIKKEKFSEVSSSFDEKYIYHIINPFMTRLRQLKSFLEFYIDFLPMSKSLSNDFMSDFSRAIIQKIDNLKPNGDMNHSSYALLTIVTIPPQILTNRTRQQQAEYKNIMISYNFDKIYNEFIDFFGEKEKQISDYIFYEIKAAGIDKQTIDKVYSDSKYHGILFFYRWDLSRVFELFFSLRSLLNRKSVYESISAIMRMLLVCYTKSCQKIIQKNDNNKNILQIIGESGLPHNLNIIAHSMFPYLDKYGRSVEFLNILIYRVSAPIKLLSTLNFFSELDELTTAVANHNIIMELLLDARAKLLKRFKSVNIDLCKKILSTDVYAILKSFTTFNEARQDIFTAIQKVTTGKKKLSKILSYYYRTDFQVCLMKYMILKTEFLEKLDDTTFQSKDNEDDSEPESASNAEAEFLTYISKVQEKEIDMKLIYDGMSNKIPYIYIFKVPNYIMSKISYPRFKFVKPNMMTMNRIMNPALFNPTNTFNIPPDINILKRCLDKFDINLHIKLINQAFFTIDNLFQDEDIKHILDDVLNVVLTSLQGINIDPEKLEQLKELGNEQLKMLEAKINDNGRISENNSLADIRTHSVKELERIIPETNDELLGEGEAVIFEDEMGIEEERVETYTTSTEITGEDLENKAPSENKSIMYSDLKSRSMNFTESINDMEIYNIKDQEKDEFEPLINFLMSTQESFQSSFMIIKPYVKQLEISYKFLSSIRFKVKNQILDLVSCIPMFKHITPLEYLLPFIVKEDGSKPDKPIDIDNFIYVKNDEITKVVQSESFNSTKQQLTFDYANPEFKAFICNVIESIKLIETDSIFSPLKKIFIDTKFTTYFEVLEMMKQSFAKAMNSLNQLANSYHVVLVQAYQMMNLPPTSPAFHRLLTGFISIFYSGIIQVVTVFLIIIYYMTSKTTDPVFNIEFIGNENDYLYFYPSLGSNDISAIIFENIKINGLNCPLIQNQIQSEGEEITLHQTFLEVYANILSLTYYPEIMYERIMGMYKSKTEIDRTEAVVSNPEETENQENDNTFKVSSPTSMNEYNYALTHIIQQLSKYFGEFAKKNWFLRDCDGLFGNIVLTSMQNIEDSLSSATSCVNEFTKLNIEFTKPDYHISYDDNETNPTKITNNMRDAELELLKIERIAFSTKQYIEVIDKIEENSSIFDCGMFRVIPKNAALYTKKKCMIKIYESLHPYIEVIESTILYIGKLIEKQSVILNILITVFKENGLTGESLPSEMPDISISDTTIKLLEKYESTNLIKLIEYENVITNITPTIVIVLLSMITDKLIACIYHTFAVIERIIMPIMIMTKETNIGIKEEILGLIKKTPLIWQIINPLLATLKTIIPHYEQMIIAWFDDAVKNLDKKLIAFYYSIINESDMLLNSEANLAETDYGALANSFEVALKSNYDKLLTYEKISEIFDTFTFSTNIPVKSVSFKILHYLMDALFALLPILKQSTEKIEDFKTRTLGSIDREYFREMRSFSRDVAHQIAHTFNFKESGAMFQTGKSMRDLQNHMKVRYLKYKFLPTDQTEITENPLFNLSKYMTSGSGENEIYPLTRFEMRKLIYKSVILKLIKKQLKHIFSLTDILNLTQNFKYKHWFSITNKIVYLIDDQSLMDKIKLTEDNPEYSEKKLYASLLIDLKLHKYLNVVYDMYTQILKTNAKNDENSIIHKYWAAVSEESLLPSFVEIIDTIYCFMVNCPELDITRLLLNNPNFTMPSSYLNNNNFYHNINNHIRSLKLFVNEENVNLTTNYNIQQFNIWLWKLPIVFIELSGIMNYLLRVKTFHSPRMRELRREKQTILDCLELCYILLSEIQSRISWNHNQVSIIWSQIELSAEIYQKVIMVLNRIEITSISEEDEEEENEEKEQKLPNLYINSKSPANYLYEVFEEDNTDLAANQVHTFDINEITVFLLKFISTAKSIIITHIFEENKPLLSQNKMTKKDYRNLSFAIYRTITEPVRHPVDISVNLDIILTVVNMLYDMDTDYSEEDSSMISGSSSYSYSYSSYSNEEESQNKSGEQNYSFDNETSCKSHGSNLDDMARDENSIEPLPLQKDSTEQEHSTERNFSSITVDNPDISISGIESSVTTDWCFLISGGSILKDKLPIFSKILNRFNLKSYFNKSIDVNSINSLNNIIMVSESYKTINEVRSNVFTDFIYNSTGKIIAIDTLFGEAIPLIIQAEINTQLPLKMSYELSQGLGSIFTDYIFPSISVYTLLVIKIIRQSYSLEHLDNTPISVSSNCHKENTYRSPENFIKPLPISFLLTQHGVIGSAADGSDISGFYVKDISTRPLMSILLALLAYINSYIIFGNGDHILPNKDNTTQYEVNSNYDGVFDKRMKRVQRILQELKETFLTLGQRFVMIKNSIYFPVPIGFLRYSKLKLSVICYFIDLLIERTTKFVAHGHNTVTAEMYFNSAPLLGIVLPKCEVDLFGSKYYGSNELKATFEKNNPRAAFVLLTDSGLVSQKPFGPEFVILSFFDHHIDLIKLYSSQFAVFEDMNNKYASNVYSVFPRAKVLLSDNNMLKYASRLAEVMIQYMYADEFIYTSNENFKNSIQAAIEQNNESSDISSLHSGTNEQSISGSQTNQLDHQPEEVKYIMNDHENQFKWFDEISHCYGSDWLAGTILSLPDVLIAIISKYCQFHCPQPLPPLQILKMVFTESEVIRAHSGYAFTNIQANEHNKEKKQRVQRLVTQENGDNDKKQTEQKETSGSILMTLTLEQVTSSNLLYFSRFKSTVNFEDLLKLPIVSFCTRALNPKLKKITDFPGLQKIPSIQKQLLLHFDMIYLSLNPITLMPLMLKNIKKKAKKVKNEFDTTQSGSNMNSSIVSETNGGSESESSNFESGSDTRSDISTSHDMDSSDNLSGLSVSSTLGQSTTDNQVSSTMSDTSSTDSTDGFGKSRQSLLVTGFGNNSKKDKIKNNKYSFIQKAIEKLFGGDFANNTAIKNIIDYWALCVIKVDMYLKFNDTVIIEAPQGFNTSIILQIFYEMCDAIGIMLRSSRTRGCFVNYNNMSETILQGFDFSNAHAHNTIILHDDHHKEEDQKYKNGCNGFLFGSEQEILNANLSMMESKILNRGGLVKKYNSFVNVSWIYSQRELYDSLNVTHSKKTHPLLPNPNILGYCQNNCKEIIITDIPNVYNKLFSSVKEDMTDVKPPHIVISDPDPEIIILLILSEWKTRSVVDNRQNIGNTDDGEGATNLHDMNGHTLNDRYNLKTGSLFQSATQAGRLFIFPLLFRPLCAVIKIVLPYLSNQNLIYPIIGQTLKILMAYFDAVIIGMNPITLRYINSEQINTIILFAFFWTLVGFYPLRDMFIDQNTKLHGTLGDKDSVNIDNLLDSKQSRPQKSTQGIKIKSAWDGVWEKFDESGSTSLTTDRSAIMNASVQNASVHSNYVADNESDNTGEENYSESYDFSLSEEVQEEQHEKIVIPKLATDVAPIQNHVSPYDVFLAPFASLKTKLLSNIKSSCSVNDSPLGFLPVLLDMKNRLSMSLESWDSIAALLFNYVDKDKTGQQDLTGNREVAGQQSKDNYTKQTKEISQMPEVLVDITPMIFNSLLMIHERNNLVFSTTETSLQIMPLVFEHLLRLFSFKYHEFILKQFSGNSVERVIKYTPEMHLVYIALIVAPNSEFQAFELGDAIGNSVTYAMYSPKSLAQNSASLEEENIHSVKLTNYIETPGYSYLANEYSKIFDPISITQANDLAENNRSLSNKLQNDEEGESEEVTSITDVYGMPICSHSIPGTIYHFDYIGEHYDAFMNERREQMNLSNNDMRIFYDTAFLNMINNNYIPLKDGYYVPNISVTHMVALPACLSNSEYIYKYNLINNKTVLMPPVLPSSTGMDSLYVEYYLRDILDEIEYQNIYLYSHEVQQEEMQGEQVDEENSEYLETEGEKEYVSITSDMVLDCIREAINIVNENIQLSINNTHKKMDPTIMVNNYYKNGIFGDREIYYILYKIKVYFNLIDYKPAEILNGIDAGNTKGGGNNIIHYNSVILSGLFDMFGRVNVNNLTYLLCMSIYSTFRILLTHPDISDAFRTEFLNITLPKLLANKLMQNIFSTGNVADAYMGTKQPNSIVSADGMTEVENAQIFTKYFTIFQKATNETGHEATTTLKTIQDPYKNVLYDLGSSLKTVRAIKNHAMSTYEDKTSENKKEHHKKKHNESGNDETGVLAKGLVAVGDCAVPFGTNFDENDASTGGSKNKVNQVTEALGTFYTKLSCVVKPINTIIEEWYTENTPGSYTMEEYIYRTESGLHIDMGENHNKDNGVKNTFLVNSDFLSTTSIHALIAIIIQNKLFASHTNYNSSNDVLGSTLGNASNPAFLARTMLSLYGNNSFICVCNSNIPLLQILQKTVQNIMDFNPFVIEFKPLIKASHVVESIMSNSKPVPEFMLNDNNFNDMDIFEYLLKHILDVYLFVAQTGKTGVVYINQNSFDLSFADKEKQKTYQEALMQIFEDLIKSSYSSRLINIMNEEQISRFRTFLLISPLMKIFLNAGMATQNRGSGTETNFVANNKHVINNDTNLEWLLGFSGVLSHVSFVIHIYNVRETQSVSSHISNVINNTLHARSNDVDYTNNLIFGDSSCLLYSWINYSPALWKSSYVMSFDDNMDVNELYDYFEKNKYLLTDDYADVAILLKNDLDKMMSTENIILNNEEKTQEKEGKKENKKSKRKEKKKSKESNLNATALARMMKMKQTQAVTSILEKVFNAIPYNIEVYDVKETKFDPRCFKNIDDAIEKIAPYLIHAYETASMSNDMSGANFKLTNDSYANHSQTSENFIMYKRNGKCSKNFIFRKYVIPTKLYLDPSRLNALIFLVCQNFSVVSMAHIINSIADINHIGAEQKDVTIIDVRATSYVNYSSFFKSLLRRLLSYIIECILLTKVYTKLENIVKVIESSKAKYDSLVIQINNNNNVLQRTLVGICHDTMQLKETTNQIETTKDEKSKVEKKIQDIASKHEVSNSLIKAMTEWMSSNIDNIKTMFYNILDKNMLSERDPIVIAFARIIIYASTGKVFDNSLEGTSEASGVSRTNITAGTMNTHITRTRGETNMTSNMKKYLTQSDGVSSDVKQVFSMFTSILRKTDAMIHKITKFMGSPEMDPSKLEIEEKLYNDFIDTIRSNADDFNYVVNEVYPLTSVQTSVIIIDNEKMKDTAQFETYLHNGVIKVHPELLAATTYSTFNVRDNLPIIYLCSFILYKIFIDKDNVASNSVLLKMEKHKKTLEEAIANFISVAEESTRRIKEESETYQEIENRVRIMKEKAYKKKRNIGIDGDALDEATEDNVPDNDGNKQFYNNMLTLSKQYQKTNMFMKQGASTVLQDSLLTYIIQTELPNILYNGLRKSRRMNTDPVQTSFFSQVVKVSEISGLKLSEIFSAMAMKNVVEPESIESIISANLINFKSINCFSALHSVGANFWDMMVDVFIQVHGVIDYNIVNAVTSRLLTTTSVNKCPVYIIDSEDRSNVLETTIPDNDYKSHFGEDVVIPIMSLIRSIEYLTCRRSKKYTFDLNEFNYNIFPPKLEPIIVSPEHTIAQDNAEIDFFTEASIRLQSVQKAMLRAMSYSDNSIGETETANANEEEKTEEVNTNVMSIDGSISITIPSARSDEFYYYPCVAYLKRPISFETFRPYAALGGEYILEHGNKNEIIIENEGVTKYTVDYDLTYNYSRKSTNYKEANVKLFMPCSMSFVCTDAVYREMLDDNLFRESTIPIRLSARHNYLTQAQHELYCKTRERREHLAQVNDTLLACDKTITSNKEFKGLLAKL